jgi:hypothetical protein
MQITLKRLALHADIKMARAAAFAQNNADQHSGWSALIRT